MSPINNFEATRRQYEFIYHQAPYTIETFNNINNPIYYDSFLPSDYNHHIRVIQPVATDDISNNLAVEITDFIKYFVFNILLSSCLSTISFFWSLVQLFFRKLYSVIIAGFLLLPYFPILSFYPFPYSLWIVFLWFLDFLDLTFFIIFILTCSFLSGVYMLVFDLLLIPFQETY